MTSPIIFAQNSVSWFEDWRENGGTTEAAYSNTASAYDNAGKLIVASSVENASGGISLSLKKLGSTGNTIWSKVFNIVQTNKILVGNIAIDDSDNIHIAATMSSGSQTTADALVIKYNTSGVKLWHKTYNNPDNNYDGALDIALMANGDVIATGGSFRTTGQMNLLTMSIDSSGTLLWSNEYNNVGLHETGLKLTLTADTASITGITQLSAFNWEYIQQKILLTDGSTLDANVTDLGAGAINSVMDATQGEDGSYYIAGSVLTDTAGYDMKIIKFDTDFIPVWTATWDSEAHDDDFTNAIEVRDNGTVYVTGYTNPADEHIVTLKFDSEGDLVWQKIRPGHGNGVTTNANGTVFVTGYTSTLGNNDFYIGVYDPDGEIIWEGGLNGAANKNDEGRVILVTPEGDIVVIGNSVDEDGDPGSLTVKYNYKTLVLPHGYEEREVSSPFRENAGQLLDSEGEEAVDIEFYAGGSNPAPFLADDHLSWVFYLTDTSYATPDTAWRVDMSLPDAYLRETKIYGIGQQEYFENYYLAHIPEGKERVRQYQYLLHANAWDNTDLFYEQSGGEMVYRMVCHPGFDPENIRWSVSGYTSMSVNGSGELVIVTPLGDLVLPAPDAWQQDTMGNVITLPWNPYWSVTDEMAYIVMGGSFDTTKVVVVKVGEALSSNTDPDYWSTYYGNGMKERLICVEHDPVNTDIYVTGYTNSMNFPAQSNIPTIIFGSSDAVAGKFNLSGKRVWMIFYGGDDANTYWDGANECGMDIAPDLDQYAYIVGRTDAPNNFPLKEIDPNSSDDYYSDDIISGTNLCSRGFVARFNKSDGARSWGTFFGNSFAARDVVTNIEISPENHPVIAGYFRDAIANDLPSPPDNPASYPNPSGNTYIAEFDENGVLVWTCPFGGGNIKCLAIDDEDNIYIAGSTWDSYPIYFENEPMGDQDNSQSGGPDVFLARFEPSRDLNWSTLLGATGGDWVRGIDVNSQGELYVLAFTYSTTIPQEHVGVAWHDPDDEIGGSNDLLITKYDSNSHIEWSTYLGGEGDEGDDVIDEQDTNPGRITFSDALSIDIYDNIYITGKTNSAQDINDPVNSFPIEYSPSGVDFYFGSINSSEFDAFLTVFDHKDQLFYSTYWGGEHADQGQSISTRAYGDYLFVSIAGYCYDLDNYPFSTTIPEVNLLPLAVFNDDSYIQPYYGGISEGFINSLPFFNVPVANEEVPLVNNFFQVIPNPASNYIQLNSLEHQSSRYRQINIYNSVGEKVYSASMTGYSDLTIDVSSFSAGVFLVAYISDVQRYSTKFIKL